ncbi:hypothetical protein DMA12_27305 [Amycolatopsis balhimycina DSM 5908]|uniref:Uncharacterized protein n=1 Tax=Amycolatopsis balhimycina DSM 5908 TaxID=1081091 RepID=A0A428WBP2_AMYBA|nr:hypothetical protein DMA12_27305 [Amycolatopsis balhimycina DSM 5908]
MIREESPDRRLVLPQPLEREENVFAGQWTDVLRCCGGRLLTIRPARSGATGAEAGVWCPAS